MAELKESGNFTDNISHCIQDRFQQCLKGFMSDVTIGNRKERIKHRMLELFKQLYIYILLYISRGIYLYDYILLEKQF